MDIRKTLNEKKLIISVSGRLDTDSAPEFEEVINTSLDGITNLTLDFSELEYISSAGLRVILAAQKIMNKQGRMAICNCEKFREIFEITGFIDFLTIKK